MHRVADSIRKNPLRVIVSLATSFGLIVGMFIGVDERYAHAGDMRQQTQALTQALEINRLQSELSVLQIRKAMLQDRVFDGAARASGARAFSQQTLAPDAAVKRAEAELREVLVEIQTKQQLIDRLRTGGR